MQTRKKIGIRTLDDLKLMKKYKYLQSKEATKNNRFSKYVLYQIKKRGLKVT